MRKIGLLSLLIAIIVVICLSFTMKDEKDRQQSQNEVQEEGQDMGPRNAIWLPLAVGRQLQAVEAHGLQLRTARIAYLQVRYSEALLSLPF